MSIKVGNKEINVASVILAGGKGERLFPLTINHSKPAMIYGGRYRLIDIPVSNSLNSNINEIFVLAQYLPKELEDHLRETYQFSSPLQGNIDFLTPETINGKTLSFEGTADAIRKSLKKILKNSFEYLLVLSGDQLYNIDFNDMLRFSVEKNADLTIATLEVEKKDAKRFGILKINEQSTVIDFIEKPNEKEVLEKFKLKKENQEKYLASMGIYIFKRKVLENLLMEKGNDFGKNLIPLQFKKGNTAAYVYEGYWEDIGTIESYYNANKALTVSSTLQYDEFHPIYFKKNYLPGTKINNTLLENSIICEGSLIEAKTIKNSIIGLRSLIKSGTVILDSIIMGNSDYKNQKFSIGENCFIKKTIIDENVVIGNNVSLTNKQNLLKYEGEGIYVRDGIIVVTKNLPHNFEF